MNTVHQIRTIAWLELRRVFFSKRSFWVYLLALFPTVIFIGHGLDVNWKRQRWTAMGVVSAEKMAGAQIGMTEDQVIAELGKSGNDHSFTRRVRKDPDNPNSERIEEKRRNMMYFDGVKRHDLSFTNGVLKSRGTRTLANFEESRKVFAGMFQFFYLRLAIFFGCLGIFINLFRGEMLDKSLHFWFLAPVKREVLLLGKYVAGLTAATFIFVAGTLICYTAMIFPHDATEIRTYMQTIGVEHGFWYAAAAALGCVGYGSVFLAAGLILRNPVIPAGVILLWESINGFLPDMLQKLSVLHYLQSLCPVPAPIDPEAPALAKLLLAPAAASSAATAVIGLIAVSALVLFAASRAVRRLEINYSTE